MRAGVAVVAVLALLAGCSGTPVGDATPTRTITPVEVPASDRIAPGVTADGVVDPQALGAAHAGALDDRSYTLTANHSSTYANGSVRSAYDVRVWLSADRDYRAVSRTAGPEAPVLLGAPPASGEFWSNGTTYVAAVSHANETRYNRFRPPDGYAGTWRYWIEAVALDGDPAAAVAGVTRAADPEPVGKRSVGGTVVYTLVGDSTTAPAGSDALVDARDAGVTVNVTETGLVRSYTLRYTATTAAGATVTVVRRVRYGNVGATTVERPDWFDRAVQ
ncbi:DUF7537 family lipoprotein [Halorarius halobius]|uniref:DUF7537 family lipoprotein n=1 Tax=Halorarius halobius TaxID=2962671 RepID=UPI0020CEE057|nr:hypothetical protein [Halorarius halobius]